MSTYFDRPSSGGPKIKRDVRTPTSADSGLRVLPPEDGRITNGDIVRNKSSTSKKSAPIRNGMSKAGTSRRTPTPTKQIQLQSTRKREEKTENFEEEPFDWVEYERQESARLHRSSDFDQSYRHNNQPHLSSHQQPSHSNNARGRDYDDTHRVSPKQTRSNDNRPNNTGSAAEEMLRKCYKKDDVSELMDEMKLADLRYDKSDEPQGATGGVSSKSAAASGDIDNSDEFDTDLEDGEEDEEKEEEEVKRKAPNDLLMEFLGYVMKEEWKKAQKLCQLILIYEPNHPEAKEFQSTIEEKVRLEEELANMSSGESGDEDDEEDDDEDDDEDDSSDDDSSDGDSDDEGQETDKEAGAREDGGVERGQGDTESVADSGIASEW